LKVLTYINKMLATPAQKDQLYYMTGYSESTISDAPWHGDSVYDGDIYQKRINGRVLPKLKKKAG
jgi:hypothetical protein